MPDAVDSNQAERKEDRAEEEHEVVVLVEQTDHKTAKDRAGHGSGHRRGVVIAGERADIFAAADGEHKGQRVDVDAADRRAADDKRDPQRDPGELVDRTVRVGGQDLRNRRIPARYLNLGRSRCPST